MNLAVFYCSENYKEAQRCLTCIEQNGCEIAREYIDDLRVAAAEKDKISALCNVSFILTLRLLMENLSC